MLHLAATLPLDPAPSRRKCVRQIPMGSSNGVSTCGRYWKRCARHDRAGAASLPVVRFNPWSTVHYAFSLVWELKPPPCRSCDACPMSPRFSGKACENPRTGSYALHGRRPLLAGHSRRALFPPTEDIWKRTRPGASVPVAVVPFLPLCAEIGRLTWHGALGRVWRDVPSGACS